MGTYLQWEQKDPDQVGVAKKMYQVLEPVRNKNPKLSVNGVTNLFGQIAFYDGAKNQ